MILKTRRLLASAAAVALLGTTSTLWAQSTAPAMEAPAASGAAMSAKDMLAAFDKADGNKDGKLTMQEAATIPGLAADFAKLDANGDGMIAKAEYEKSMKK